MTWTLITLRSWRRKLKWIKWSYPTPTTITNQYISPAGIFLFWRIGLFIALFKSWWSSSMTCSKVRIKSISFLSRKSSFKETVYVITHYTSSKKKKVRSSSKKKFDFCLRLGISRRTGLTKLKYDRFVQLNEVDFWITFGSWNWKPKLKTQLCSAQVGKSPSVNLWP